MSRTGRPKIAVGTSTDYLYLYDENGRRDDLMPPEDAVLFDSHPLAVSFFPDLSATRTLLLGLDLHAVLKAEDERAQFFIDALPTDILGAINGLREGALRLLQLRSFDEIEGSEKFSKLLRINPCLAFILAHADTILGVKMSLEQMHELSYESEQDILIELGYEENSKAMAKLLRQKVAASDLDHERARFLVRLPVTNPLLFQKILNLDRINGNLIDILMEYGDLLLLCKTQLLTSIVDTDFDEGNRKPILSLDLESLRLSLEIRRRNGQLKPDKKLPIRCISRIGDAANRIAAKEELPDEEPPFIEPPIPEMEGVIIPITNIDQLEEEGIRMVNCLRRDDRPYWRAAHIGTGYVYKVLGAKNPPDHMLERSTVFIVREGDKWVISEIEAQATEEEPLKTKLPNDTTINFVTAWLEAEQMAML